MAKMNIAPQEHPRVKLECLRLLATLRLYPARMKLISGFIDTYLRLNAEEEQLFQVQISTIESSQPEVVMEIVTSWMEQGIEQGRQQGEVALIMRLLNRRFGGVTPKVETRIRSLSIEQLENLGEALLDFSDASDLAAWLNGQIT
jgi:predicted transposase YdaD